MLEGYLSGLEENEVRFISENHENFRIIVDEEHFFRLQHERIEKDIVEGYLFNNRTKTSHTPNGLRTLKIQYFS